MSPSSFVNNRLLALFMAAALLAISIEPAAAQLTAPPAPPGGAGGEDIFSIIKAWVKNGAETALIVIVIISFVVAAYSAITALTRFISGRADWGGMFVIFLVAIVATVFVGQLAFEGSELVKKLL